MMEDSSTDTESEDSCEEIMGKPRSTLVPCDHIGCHCTAKYRDKDDKRHACVSHRTHDMKFTKRLCEVKGCFEYYQARGHHGMLVKRCPAHSMAHSTASPIADNGANPPSHFSSSAQALPSEISKKFISNPVVSISSFPRAQPSAALLPAKQPKQNANCDSDKSSNPCLLPPIDQNKQNMGSDSDKSGGPSSPQVLIAQSSAPSKQNASGNSDKSSDPLLPRALVAQSFTAESAMPPAKQPKQNANCDSDKSSHPSFVVQPPSAFHIVPSLTPPPARQNKRSNHPSYVAHSSAACPIVLPPIKQTKRIADARIVYTVDMNLAFLLEFCKIKKQIDMERPVNHLNPTIKVQVSFNFLVECAKLARQFEESE